ncbi:rhodanese-like domain-containing protein [Ditylenchus destructor]|uniref:protein-tyrosine-phosphatase n=1 Tax=Ditylenchus destructor TaxID=166010 RepID=A0AAD4R9N1_9BILA|nr:rhodanese-like domain-containing protein [Ditylenchus destructor]
MQLRDVTNTLNSHITPKVRKRLKRVAGLFNAHNYSQENEQRVNPKKSPPKIVIQDEQDSRPEERDGQNSAKRRRCVLFPEINDKEIPEPARALHRVHSMAEFHHALNSESFIMSPEPYEDYTLKSVERPQIPHRAFRSISGETMCQLLQSMSNEIFCRKFVLVDCRYPFEFNGGHIRHAINLYDLETMIKIFFPLDENAFKEMKVKIPIFYCEFSQKRGPTMATELRRYDRKRNEFKYPCLDYKEIYLLDHGYRKFYAEDKFIEFCEPSDYVPMLHPHHGVELRKYNNHRRRQPIKSVPNRSDRFEVIEDSRPALSQEVFPITRLSMRSSSLLNSNVYAQKSVELTPEERENIFPYECFLPDGRRYRSTIPCPSYDDNGQVIPRVARASQGNGNVCANGGTFAGTYCLGDYNCNENRLNSNMECVRAMCCTRTNSPKASVNVRNNNDIQLCPNGGYYMSRQCTQNADCNVGDTGRATRGYSIQKCVQSRSNRANSNCCSKQYVQPSRRGDRCLNGGMYTGQNCVNEDDCQAASSRLNRGRRRQITNRGGNRAAACVERVCCTTKRYPNNYNGDDYESDDYDRTDADDSSALDEDHSVCRNGGAVVADENGEIVYCQSHAECGGLVDGRWNAICSGGRCCYNTGTLGGRNGADYQRGQDMCNTLAPAPGIYTGYKCDTPSDCGDYHDYDDTYSCIGGYCCEEDFDLVSGDGIVPGVTQRDRVCNNRGFFLGNSCIGSRECRRSKTRGRVNLCINRSCCSVPTRQRDYGSGFADYNSVCPRAPFRYYLGETCRRRSDCPVLAGPNGRRQQVRCNRGFCCGVGTTPFGYGTLGNSVGGAVGPYLGRDTTYFPPRPPGSIVAVNATVPLNVGLIKAVSTICVVQKTRKKENMFVADWEQMVPVLLPSSAQMIYIACRVNSVVSVSLDNPNWEWRIVGKELGHVTMAMPVALVAFAVQNARAERSHTEVAVGAIALSAMAVNRETFVAEWVPAHW